MSVKVHPLADYVVAVAEEAKAKTTSGFYLPEKSTEKPKVAKVVAVGTATMQVKVGDRVIYKSYGPTEIKVDGIEYLLIKEEDILATVAE